MGAHPGTLLHHRLRLHRVCSPPIGRVPCTEDGVSVAEDAVMIGCVLSHCAGVISVDNPALWTEMPLQRRNVIFIQEDAQVTGCRNCTTQNQLTHHSSVDLRA